MIAAKERRILFDFLQNQSNIFKLEKWSAWKNQEYITEEFQSNYRTTCMYKELNLRIFCR